MSEKNSQDKITSKSTSDKNHLFCFCLQNLKNSISFSASYEENNIEHYFENIMNFEKLRENKYLHICEKIQEIYDELKDLLNENELKIKEEIDKIFISIPTGHRRHKEILFSSDEKKDYLKTNSTKDEYEFKIN